MMAVDPSLAVAFETALRAGRLVFRYCKRCDVALPPERALCPECWSRQLETRQSSGMGRLYSKVVFRRAFADHPRVPYTVAQVELEEGPRVIGLLEGNAIPGDPVRAQLETGAEGAVLKFRPIVQSKESDDVA